MNAKQLKISILQEAIEGRLVPQDPNDEPASALLARIRAEKQRLVKEGVLKKSELKEREFDLGDVPFSIPKGWIWTKIDNIAFVTKLAGFEYTKYIASNLVRKEDGIPLFKGKNVQNGKIVYNFESYIPINLSNELKRSQINKKCLLTPYVGTIGNIGIHDKEGLFHLGSNVGKIEFYNGTKINILEEYAKYYLMSRNGYQELTKYKKATAQESISIEAIRDVFIPLPPIKEQVRIVEKISTLFSKIEEYGKAQDALDKLSAELPERLKKSILQEAIEGRLVPQDPNDEPASVLLQRIRAEKERLAKEGKLKKKDLIETPISDEEKPFEIPDSWEWVRLGEISTYAHTKKKINAAKANPNLWGLDLEDIEKGGRLLCIKSVGERKPIGDKTCFSGGDILYSKLRPYLLKILIAPQEGICTPEIIPFTCYGSLCNEYIVYLLKSAYVDDYINSVTFGVKMPRVSTETMTSLIIPIPPLAEQKRIVAKIEELFKHL